MSKQYPIQNFTLADGRKARGYSIGFRDTPDGEASYEKFKWGSWVTCNDIDWFKIDLPERDRVIGEDTMTYSNGIVQHFTPRDANDNEITIGATLFVAVRNGVRKAVVTKISPLYHAGYGHYTRKLTVKCEGETKANTINDPRDTYLV